MGLPPDRRLVVVADDYGIGPETSRAIRELSWGGRLTGTVLLVNGPWAEEAAAAWRRERPPVVLGWHPCLTMDPPVAPVGRVSSLVGPDGRLRPLGQLLRRWLLGRICPGEVAVELGAQLHRFIELAGHPPLLVNAHQHVALFSPIGPILLDLLRSLRPRPYVRRVREPWRTLARVPGARPKRAFLGVLGRRLARLQDRLGFPGAKWLAGVTDPAWVTDPRFFARWLAHIPGRTVELVCHPGYWDDTLPGRDCSVGDGLQQRRVDELALLRQPSVEHACRDAGFRLLSGPEFSQWMGGCGCQAA